MKTKTKISAGIAAAEVVDVHDEHQGRPPLFSQDGVVVFRRVQFAPNDAAFFGQILDGLANYWKPGVGQKPDDGSRGKSAQN
jgi:hypothetical protein